MARFSENGELKLCTGFLHKDNPTWLPLTRFPNTSYSKSGVLPECKDCRRARQGRGIAKTKVPMEEANQIFHRLIEIYGSKAGLARELGVGREFLSRGYSNVSYANFEKASKLLATHEKGKSNTNGEAEVVDPEPLGAIVRKFCVDWFAERPMQHKSHIGFGHQENDVRFVGPVQYLANNAGISTRHVGRIARNELEHISLSAADAVLTAMGLTLEMVEIEPKPNPFWSIENYRSYMKARGCI